MTRIAPRPPPSTTRSVEEPNRAQVGGTVAELKDLLGNQDGIWGNEDKKAGTTGDVFDTNPLALRVRVAASTGVSAADELKLLADFVKDREAAWGRPVMDDDVKVQLNGGELFAAQKAIALTRYGREPDDVKERFVDASGSVNGKNIAPARVFTQHFEPLGTPSGDVVVMSPGFLESGRAFLDQVDRLNKAGAYVVVMDHQWAGQTDGKKGGIANGESIALHVAAVVEDAARIGRERYGDQLHLAVVGESMGGGPGALGAVLMARAGKLEISGSPQSALAGDVDLFLQAPYLAATPTLVNKALAMAGQIPLLNRIAAPALGLPDFVEDPRGEHLVAQAMVVEDVRGRTQAFGASDSFVTAMNDLLSSGVKPGGRVMVAHDEQDPLADFTKSEALVKGLGDGAQLYRLQGGDHGLSASDPDVVEHLIAHLGARRAASG